MLKSGSGVFVLSASNYSAYTISVLTLLQDNNVPICGVSILNIASASRFLTEMRQSGLSIFKKVYKKIILQRFSSSEVSLDGFSSRYRSIGCNMSSVTDFCEEYEIEYMFTSDFHNRNVLEFVRSINPELVVFTGGGLIRQALIDISGMGIINCHMGVLPQYRGMDCTHWCVLNKDLKNIGFTTHLIDIGVDTGPIIKVHYVDLCGFGSINDIVFDIEFRMAPAIVEATLMLLKNGNSICSDQNINDGCQYYRITPEISTVAEQKYIAYNNG